MKSPQTLETLLDSLPDGTKVEVRGQGPSRGAKWTVEFTVEVPDTEAVLHILGEGDTPTVAAAEARGLYFEFHPLTR